jgi:hypothetical protein
LIQTTDPEANQGQSPAQAQDVVPCDIKPFLHMKRIAGFVKGTLSTVTGDMLMLTVLFVLPEGFDIFKLGTIVTGGKMNLSGNLSFTKITLVGWMFGS